MARLFAAFFAVTFFIIAPAFGDEALFQSFGSVIRCVRDLNPTDGSDNLIMFNKDRMDKSRLVLLGSRNGKKGLWIFERTGTQFLPLDYTRTAQYRLDFPDWAIFSKTLYFETSYGKNGYDLSDERGTLAAKNDSNFIKTNPKDLQNVPEREAASQLSGYLKKFFGSYNKKVMSQPHPSTYGLGPNDLQSLDECRNQIADDGVKEVIASAVQSHQIAKTKTGAAIH